MLQERAHRRIFLSSLALVARPNGDLHMKLKSSNGWRRRVVTCRLLAIFVAMTLAIVAMSGCSGSRYLSVRKVPRTRWPARSICSHARDRVPRTGRFRHCVDMIWRSSRRKIRRTTLTQLQQEIANEPTADKIHAFSELAYIAAYKADATGDDTRSVEFVWCGGVSMLTTTCSTRHMMRFATHTIRSFAARAMSTTPPWRRRCGWSTQWPAAAGREPDGRHGDGADPNRRGDAWIVASRGVRATGICFRLSRSRG